MQFTKYRNNSRDKPLHGQYSTRTKQASVDKPRSHQWLDSAAFKA